MSFRCGRCRWPRLRGMPRPAVALPVAASPGLTRRPGCRSFWFCGRIGWRACGGEPSAGFLPGGLMVVPVSSGYPFGYSPNPALQATGRIKPRPAPELSRWAFPEGRRMSFRCGRCRRPRLRGKLRAPVALLVAALPGLTRRPGCRSFWSCGRIGWRACGGEPSAGFLPRGLVAFPVSSGHAFGHSPNPALQATGRIKPRPAPELSRWAFTGESA